MRWLKHVLRVFISLLLVEITFLERELHPLDVVTNRLVSVALHITGQCFKVAQLQTDESPCRWLLLRVPSTS